MYGVNNNYNSTGYEKESVFYKTLNENEIQILTAYHKKDLPDFIKCSRKNIRNIFEMSIDSNGNFFLEKAFSFLKISTYFPPEKYSFYKNIFQIALKKTSPSVINERYSYFNEESPKIDIILEAFSMMNVNNKSKSDFFNIINHFPNIMTANKRRTAYVALKYSNKIFEDRDLYSFFQKKELNQFLYPYHKESFEDIFSSLLNNEKEYSKEEILDFLNVAYEDKELLSIVVDDSFSIITLLIEHFNENNSDKIFSVIEDIVKNEKSEFFTEEEDKNPFIVSIREHIKLTSIFNNQEDHNLEPEVKSKAKRL